MGSVPNCRKEIADRYPIRWFKCKLKPPKKQDNHYSGLLKQGLSKMKADYETKIKETLADNESRFQCQQQDHRAQLEALTAELDEWKHKSSTGPTNVIETAAGPIGDQLGQLKNEIYNFLPGTVKIALCGLRWFKLNVSKCQKDGAIVYRGYGVQGV